MSYISAYLFPTSFHSSSGWTGSTDFNLINEDPMQAAADADYTSCVLSSTALSITYGLADVAANWCAPYGGPEYLRFRYRVSGRVDDAVGIRCHLIKKSTGAVIGSSGERLMTPINTVFDPYFEEWMSGVPTLGWEQDTTTSYSVVRANMADLAIRFEVRRVPSMSADAMTLDLAAIAVIYTYHTDIQFTQHQFGFYEDGTEAGSTIIGSANTNITRNIVASPNLLLRVGINETTPSNPTGGSPDDKWKLQYRKNAGAWTDVTTTSSNVKAFASANLTDGGATTQRLGAGTGAFKAGKISETGVAGPGPQIGFTNTRQFSEFVYPITLVEADLTNADTLDFRVQRVTIDATVPVGTMTETVVPRITVTKVSPAITQAAYQFFDDAGTESGAAALAAQNTPVTGILAGSDGYGQIRVRLQSTTAVDVPSTDDFTLQWEKNASGTWENVASGDVLLTSYDETNRNAGTSIGNLTSSRISIAQSFLGNGSKLSRAGFVLQRNGSPDGNLTAVLYAHTGTFGTTGTPTGTALATSTARASSVATSGSYNWTYFDFDKTFTLVNGTAYCIAILTTQTLSDTANINVGNDSSSPTAAGSAAIQNTSGGAWSSSSLDLIFSVYTEGPKAVVTYDSPTLTEGAATTNRLTGGTGTFVPGKVSEDGVVDNLGWTGNNHTEILYSVRLVAANLVNGDTLRFRVIRNGVTAEMTYSATPTLTLAVAAPDQAVRFDAAGDKYTGSAPGAQAAYSMCAWIYPTTTAQSIMLGFDGFTEYSQLVVGSNNEVRWWQETWNQGSGVIVPANTWAFVALSANGATAKTLYVAKADDTSLTTTAITGGTGVLTAGDIFYIGTNGFGDYPFNGRVAEVKIWTAALSQAEIEAEWRLQGVARTANLWAYYSFYYGPQTNDESGNGRTLTAGGTLTAEAGPSFELPTYADIVLADSPWVYCELETFGATTPDSSGNGRTVNVRSGSYVGLTTGIVGNGFEAIFHDSSSFIVQTQTPSNPPTTFSWEAWFRTSVEGQICWRGQLSDPSVVDGAEDDVVYVTSAGNVEFRGWSTADGVYRIAATSGTDYSDNAWHHVVATESVANGKRIYVDGVLEATGLYSADTTFSASYLRFGGVYPGGAPAWAASGDQAYSVPFIDECAFYTTELSAARVLAHYEAAPALAPSEIGLWNGVEVLEMQWGSQLVSDYRVGA